MTEEAATSTTWTDLLTVLAILLLYGVVGANDFEDEQAMAQAQAAVADPSFETTCRAEPAVAASPPLRSTSVSPQPDDVDAPVGIASRCIDVPQ